ncbi:hypothetical protein V8E53_009147 [Lactarius tabidus]
MYYTSKDDYNPYYAPHIGPAAMPSPHSRSAPYFSGRCGTFEEFLEEFEARAYDCRLTDLQRVDVLVRYVDPPVRETCKSLNGYRSCDWSLFRHSLVNVFGTTTTRHQIMKQKLRNLVEDSSRIRMDREEDVLQYYRTFKHYSDPLVRSGHLTETNRDVEFWYGFHPHDRDILWQRLLAVHPFHRNDIPFHFEDVFDCACKVFAYEERLSFWPRDQEFEHPSISRRYPSHPYTSDPSFPSFSRLFSESQHMHAPSVTKVQPEPEPEPEFMPSITPPSLSAPSVTSSCTNNVPKSELECISNTPISPPLLPSASFACSYTDVVPESETETTPPNSITPLTSFSIPPTPSLASSCTNDVPESEPEPAFVPSIIPTSPPSLSSASSCTAVDPEPESISENACLSLNPSMSPVLSIPLVPASCTNVFPKPEHASSFSSALSHVASSCMNVIPEPEPVSDHVFSSSFPSTSPPELMPSHVPPSLTCSPAKVQLPELASPITSTSAQASSIFKPSPSTSTSPSTLKPDPLLVVALLPDPWTDPSTLVESLSQPSVSRKFESIPAVPTIDHVLLNLSKTSSAESCDTIPSPSALLEVSNAPISHPTLQERTLRVTLNEVAPAVTSTPSSITDRSHTSPSPVSAISSSRLDPHSSSLGEILPVHPTPPLEVSSNRSSPHSSPSQPLPRLASLEYSNVPIPPHSVAQITLLERKFGPVPANSDSSTLDLTLVNASLRPLLKVTLQIASARPQLYPVPRPLKMQDLPFIHEDLSTLAPRLHISSPSLFSSSSRSARPNFALTVVNTTILFSAFINVSAAIFTNMRKLQSKNEDVSCHRNDITMTGNTFDLVQLFQLVQYLPYAARLVFDPGGLV